MLQVTTKLLGLVQALGRSMLPCISWLMSDMFGLMMIRISSESHFHRMVANQCEAHGVILSPLLRSGGGSRQSGHAPVELGACRVRVLAHSRAAEPSALNSLGQSGCSSRQLNS